MEPKWGPGPIRGPRGPREGKRCPKWSGFGLDWAPFRLRFGTWGHLFGSRFLMLFRKGSFSVFGRFLGAQGGQKGSKMEPKWMPKRAWGHPLGSVKTMAGAVFSAYQGGSGRVREATFSRLGLQTFFGGVLGCIFCDFRRFWCPFGVPLGSFSDQKGVQKGGLKKGSP